jgi:rSAM/selenodomain-associated transferase 1
VQPLVIVFAKAPIPGQVKTRLLSRLTALQAARLHEQFVSRTLDIVSHFRSVELHTDVETSAWPQFPGPRRLQTSGDLGQRLYHVLQSARPDAPVLVLGSDAPTLPYAHLTSLLDTGCEIALGPAEDGGYYAIAARRTHPGMFQGVRWSTPSAFADTRAACQHCGLTVGTGPLWWDVDEPADLDRLGPGFPYG